MADNSYLSEFQNLAGGVLTFVRELATAGDVMAEFFDRPRLYRWVVKFRRTVQELLQSQKKLLSQLKAGRPAQILVPDIDRILKKLRQMQSLMANEFDSSFAISSQQMPGSPKTQALRLKREELIDKFTDIFRKRIDTLSAMRDEAAQGNRKESVTKLTQAITLLTDADKVLGELLKKLK